MNLIDGDVFTSTEKDLERERAERDQLPARREAARQAQADAQAAALAQRQADELAAIEARLERHFVGTAAEWEKEKTSLIQAERHRLTQEAESQARRTNAATYM